MAAILILFILLELKGRAVWVGGRRMSSNIWRWAGREAAPVNTSVWNNGSSVKYETCTDCDCMAASYRHSDLFIEQPCSYKSYFVCETFWQYTSVDNFLLAYTYWSNVTKEILSLAIVYAWFSILLNILLFVELFYKKLWSNI